MSAVDRIRYGAWPFVALVATTQGSCSLVLDTTAQQCNTDVDCANRRGPFAGATCVSHVCVASSDSSAGGATTTGVTMGVTAGGAGGSSSVGGAGSGGSAGGDAGPNSDAALDPVWGCLGHVVMGTPQSATVKVSLPFWDLIRMMPITDVSVRTCPKLDVSCSRPIQAAVAAGPDGVVTLDVPALFDGYGQVLGPNVGDAGTDAGGGGDAGSAKYVPSLVFFNPPLVRDTIYEHVPLFVPDDITTLALAQGNTWDMQHGMAFIGTLDCNGKLAAGVAWEPSVVDMLTKRFYLINGFPDEAAASTDTSGLGGMLNAPAGTITFTARVQATGQRIGSATMLVRAGVASYTYLSPTP